MKKLIPILLAVFFVNMLFAKPITKKQALEVAQNYFKYRANDYQSSDIKSVHINKYNSLTSYYVVNFKEGGFVIVAADDRVKPILAYSLKNSIPKNVKNQEVNYWLEGYNKQIEYAVSNNLINQDILTEWNEIRNENFSKSTKAVAPLLTTTWDQMGAYNNYCPSNTPTGCVATAMAQIMNYWEFPGTGVNWHTYVHPSYGAQTVYFTDGDYDWSSMPDASGNDAVAWLMYHCGVAVDMDYGPSGSGAQSRNVTYTLANYFKYDQGIDIVSIDDYSSGDWIALLKDELDNSRPVYYSGDDGTSGHAFVFDGYDDSDNFHVNWGWSGSSNGYFAIGALNPGGENFNEGNEAVIGIEPTTAGNEVFLGVNKYTDFTNESEYPGYISAVDDMVAWATGRDGSGGGGTFRDYTRTTDGGATWESVSITNLGGTEFSMIQGLSADIAYIAMYGTGTDNHILRTVNGGDDWESILDGAGGASFFNVVHFFNENDGMVQGDPVGGEYELYTTTDGGDTWTPVSGSDIPNPEDASEYGIVGYYTAVGDVIWYTTNNGYVYKSSDKGYTWNKYEIAATTNSTNISVAFDEGAQNGLALYFEDVSVGIYTYYRTTDGGVTWTLLTPPANAYFTGITAVPGEANTFISVGGNQDHPQGISKTTDVGNTWTDLADYYQAFQIVGVDFVNIDKGYTGTFCSEWAGGMIVFGEPSAELVAEFTVQDAGGIDSMFCINTDITFTNVSTGFINSYGWDFGADATPATATTAGPHVVQYSAGGQKTITLTVQDDYDTDAFSANIKIAENAPNDIDTIYGPTTVIEKESTHIYSVDADPEVNTFYAWHEDVAQWDNNGSTTNEFQVTFGGFDATSDITCFASNGCGDGASYAISVHYTDGVGIEEINPSINLFPNPASNNIEIAGIAGSSVMIYDISGKMVYSVIADSNSYIIDITNLAEGFYTVKISDGKEITTGKFNIVR